MTRIQAVATVGRPEDAEVTRRILGATVELISEVGYGGLRVEHVAQRAGCGKATIYRRYTDKAGLVASAAMSVLEVGEAPDTGSLEGDLLEHALVNHRNQQRQGPSAESRSGLLAIFEPEVFPLLWERYFRNRRNQGVEIVARGIARGEIAAGADADVLLDAIAGLTLYRGTVKRVDIPVAHYRSVIAALVAHPPRVVAE
ncbi:TetR/AcrR family transcriptional regulator [Streptomyces sp. NPDC005775]|uniref:TetR/AcrR family transcriptional regulator n=1 Tax=Streptomyces sp. NPDC005775 TaxID=3364729 RepID=UPI0036A5DEA7